MPKTNCVATRQSEQARASRPVFASAILFLISLICTTSASAMSVRDYEALPIHQQSVYSGDFIEKMTADIGRTNPRLMQDIRDWFSDTPPGKRFPEGIEKLSLELGALHILARKGKADISKIQIEGVIVRVIKDKFPILEKDKEKTPGGK